MSAPRSLPVIPAQAGIQRGAAEQSAAPRRPVLRWHGGKWKIAPWVIAHFPPHRVYVEPFGGAASVLLQKPPAITDVWNDLDHNLVNLFTVLRTDAAALAEKVALTPFSRAEFKRLYEPCDEPIERARRFVARSFMGQSSKGALRKTGFDSRINPDGYCSRLAALRALPAEFAAIAARFSMVVIENAPALDVIDQYDRPEALFYIDPPYLGDHAPHYRHEMDAAAHRRLIARLLTMRSMVALSGYASPFYNEALAHWRRFVIKTHADRAAPRTEVLWLNEACAAALGHGPLFERGSA